MKDKVRVLIFAELKLPQGGALSGPEEMKPDPCRKEEVGGAWNLVGLGDFGGEIIGRDCSSPDRHA